MKLSIFFSLTLISFLSEVFHSVDAYAAERTLVLMGGGGAPKSEKSTQFDNMLNTFGKYLETNKWKTSISFNGGHSTTETILQMTLPNPDTTTSFTENNFNALIAKYENQIKNGALKPGDENYKESINKTKLKSGDQLMIIIDSHGAIQVKNQSTHSIAVGNSYDQSDLTNLKDTKTVPLDKLENLTKLAKANGIKLAILDFSCHSGASLSLANENTCVIASSGPKHFSYSDFSPKFIRNMASGKSLEDVFLKTRKGATDISFPMISSDEGKFINNEIYSTITPYLYYYKDKVENKLATYLLDNTSDQAQCLRTVQYNELQKKLDNILAISALNMDASIDGIRNLKKLFAEYKDVQDAYLSQMRSTGMGGLDHLETFIGNAMYNGSPIGPDSLKATWKEILETDYDALINKESEQVKRISGNSYTKSQLQRNIDINIKARAKKAEILSKNPGLANYQQKFQNQIATMTETVAIATKIAIEEKNLYDFMYRNLQKNKKPTATKNPCKDFVL
ncbi:MAG: hypothetical protein Q7U04_13780 [Bacteriovorax sp.]|nr:hypothetical protein [Bacteriovorax sp.]